MSKLRTWNRRSTSRCLVTNLDWSVHEQVSSYEHGLVGVRAGVQLQTWIRRSTSRCHSALRNWRTWAEFQTCVRTNIMQCCLTTHNKTCVNCEQKHVALLFEFNIILYKAALLVPTYRIRFPLLSRFSCLFFVFFRKLCSWMYCLKTTRYHVSNFCNWWDITFLMSVQNETSCFDCLYVKSRYSP